MSHVRTALETSLGRNENKLERDEEKKKRRIGQVKRGEVENR